MLNHIDPVDIISMTKTPLELAGYYLLDNEIPPATLEQLLFRV